MCEPKSEMGNHPIYVMGQKRNRVAVFHPGIGSAMAAAGLEQIIALGAKKMVHGNLQWVNI